MHLRIGFVVDSIGNCDRGERIAWQYHYPSPVTQYNIKPCYFIGVGQFASGSAAELKKTEKTAASWLLPTSPQVMGAALLLGYI